MEKTLTEKLRENPWMMGTIVMGVFVLLCIANSFITINKEIDDFTSVITLCEKASVTPSWANEKGGIIAEGYNSFGNQSWNVVDELIEQKIYFIYSSNCGWCKKQIEYFGTTWEKYVESGLTIKCS